jgi:hypothetical protein
MAAVRGDYPDFPWAPLFQQIVAAALAVMFAVSLTTMAAAQTPPSSRIPEKIEPPLTPSPENGNKDKFNREDGLVRPPSNIDPEKESKPRDNGARMPVIPPPGSPGGDEKVHPK